MEWMWWPVGKWNAVELWPFITKLLGKGFWVHDNAKSSPGCASNSQLLHDGSWLQLYLLQKRVGNCTRQIHLALPGSSAAPLFSQLARVRPCFLVQFLHFHFAFLMGCLSLMVYHFFNNFPLDNSVVLRGLEWGKLLAAQMGGCHYYATRKCAPVCSTHACLDLLGRISWLHMALNLRLVHLVLRILQMWPLYAGPWLQNGESPLEKVC